MISRLAPDLAGLKATTHALVDAVGGTNAAQIICGHRSPSTVSAAASISSPDRYLALDDLMELEKRAQQPIVSAWLVARHKEARQPVRRDLSVDDVVRLAKEGSEAKLAIATAHARRLSDGSFSAADRAVIARELRDLNALTAELIEALEASS